MTRPMTDGGRIEEVYAQAKALEYELGVSDRWELQAYRELDELIAAGDAAGARDLLHEIRMRDLAENRLHRSISEPLRAAGRAS